MNQFPATRREMSDCKTLYLQRSSNGKRVVRNSRVCYSGATSTRPSFFPSESRKHILYQLLYVGSHAVFRDGHGVRMPTCVAKV